MSCLAIRPMEEADLPALCRAEGSETTEGRECFARYFAWQQEGGCVFLLAFVNEALAGHLFVFFHDAPACRPDLEMSRLADLLVYEPFHGQGIASALLLAGEARARTFCDCAFLTVGPDLPIRQAYERRGYTFFGFEGDDAVLVKRLK